MNNIFSKHVTWSLEKNIAANISKKDCLIDYMDSKHVTWSLEKKDSSKHVTWSLEKRDSSKQRENNLNNMFLTEINFPALLLGTHKKKAKKQHKKITRILAIGS
ncbi:hypothetical protein ACJX0J_024882 [Zea mays]